MGPSKPLQTIWVALANFDGSTPER
jgi:hypothetical protein